MATYVTTGTCQWNEVFTTNLRYGNSVLLIIMYAPDRSALLTGTSLLILETSDSKCCNVADLATAPLQQSSTPLLRWSHQQSGHFCHFAGQLEMGFMAKHVKMLTSQVIHIWNLLIPKFPLVAVHQTLLPHQSKQCYHLILTYMYSLFWDLSPSPIIQHLTGAAGSFVLINSTIP